MLFTSCSVFNPSVMIRTRKDYPFDTFVKGNDSTYRIGPNDVIDVRILTNDGEGLINLTSKVEQQGGSGTGGGKSEFGGIPIQVEYDGSAKLPIIGRHMMAGKTRREAEDYLETEYAKFYDDPFVTIHISNRQVIVFPGTGNNAQVVRFKRDNMNLLEALAEVGGIANTGKARRIKLIRGDLKNPQVYLINLSTLKGMKEADLVLQSGDIIYVEPYEDPAVIFNRSVLPYFAALGSVASVVTAVALIVTLTK